MNSKDAARVIFLASPQINSLNVALEMSKITKQVVITENTLLKTIGNVICCVFVIFLSIIKLHVYLG